MKPIIGLAISLCCVSLNAQQFTGTRRGGFADGVTPVSAAVFNPTNGFGLSAAHWYEPSQFNSYGTNGSGFPVLQNLTSLGHGFDKTNNVAAADFPVGDARGNGFITTLDYVASQWVENTAFTNRPSGEYWMVLAVTNNTITGAQFMLDSENGSARQAFFDPDNGSFDMNSGGSDFVCAVIYNRFFVVDAVFDSANSLYYCFTNGVLGRIGAGEVNQPAQGIRTGIHNAGIDGALQAVAIEFDFTNTVLDTTANFFQNTVRSNAFHYCTNRIAQLGLPYP